MPKRRVSLGALRLLIVLLSLLVLLATVGCGTNAISPDVAPLPESTQEESAGETDFDFSYTERDQDASYEESELTTITLANNLSSASGAFAEAVLIVENTVTITAEGTYLLSGSLVGSVVVDAKDAKVQLVLDGVDITNGAAPALLVAQADKVFITLAEGSQNSLTDGGERSDLASVSEAADANDAGSAEAAAEETAAIRDATLFSHDDLTINGSGSLTVRSSVAHGIVSKDDLVICGGIIEVDAALDGLQGKDCVKIDGGALKVSAGDDGVSATEADEPERLGFVSITGGDLNISATNKGLRAQSLLRVAGGSVTIAASEEGYEAPLIWLLDGEQHITATDDGINAAGDARTDYALDIQGGSLFVNAEGDGLDSNGSLNISGGLIVVAGPVRQGNGGLDSQNGMTISGGTLLAVDASGMSETFESSSAQASVLYQIGSAGAAGSVVALVDEQGQALFVFETPKQYTTLVFSSPALTLNASYRFVTDVSVPQSTSNGFAADVALLTSAATTLTTFELTYAHASVNADGTVAESIGGWGGGMWPGGGGANPGSGMGPGGMAPEGAVPGGTERGGGGMPEAWDENALPPGR
jgi:hypothetical protein